MDESNIFINLNKKRKLIYENCINLLNKVLRSMTCNFFLFHTKIEVKYNFVIQALWTNTNTSKTDI